MAPVMNVSVFPSDVLAVLKQYLDNPKASTTGDQDLYRILKKYDHDVHGEFVENLPLNALFQLPNGRVFRKKEKLRKRYRCLCLNDNRIYLFSPVATVFRSISSL
jgi:hypothetical protein